MYINIPTDSTPPGPNKPWLWPNGTPTRAPESPGFRSIDPRPEPNRSPALPQSRRGREGVDFNTRRGREGVDFNTRRSREGVDFNTRRGREGVDFNTRRGREGARAPFNQYACKWPRPARAGHSYTCKWPRPARAGHLYTCKWPRPARAGHSYTCKWPRPARAGHLYTCKWPRPARAGHLSGHPGSRYFTCFKKSNSGNHILHGRNDILHAEIIFCMQK